MCENYFGHRPEAIAGALGPNLRCHGVIPSSSAVSHPCWLQIVFRARQSKLRIRQMREICTNIENAARKRTRGDFVGELA